MRSQMSARDYSGPYDLKALLGFASATQTSRFPLDSSWHPGDIIWSLRGQVQTINGLRLWASNEVEAAAWFDGPGDLWIEAHPAADLLIPDIIRWAEDHVAKDGPVLRVRLFDLDQARTERLMSLGYRRCDPDMVHMRRDLSRAIPGPQLPVGFQIRDCVEVDPDRRAECHRNAWNHLAHIGLSEARSTFSTADYERLRAAPGYDPALDLIVETADGRLVANCICWSDSSCGIGTFEPVGVHVDFRRMGLARALTLEGLHRLQAANMRWGRIGTAHFNTPAIATYLSSGFEITDRSYWWSKPPN